MKPQHKIEAARQAIRAREAETRSEAINRYLLDAESQGDIISHLKFDLRLPATVAILAALSAAGIAAAANLNLI